MSVFRKSPRELAASVSGSEELDFANCCRGLSHLLLMGNTTDFSGAPFERRTGTACSVTFVPSFAVPSSPT